MTENSVKYRIKKARNELRRELDFWQGMIRNINSIVALIRKYKIEPMAAHLRAAETQDSIEISQQSDDGTVSVFRIKDDS